MLLILSGPSGVGKTTLCDGLLRRHPRLGLSVSYTTRSPRGAEVDGVAYHFVTHERFAQMTEQGAFAEHAEVHGNRYGTARATIDAALGCGRGVLFDIDFQGAFQLRAAYPDAVLVMILPPDMPGLEARLRGRGTDSEAVIARRVEAARHEMKQAGGYDYVVTNGELAHTEATLDAIVRAEEVRASRVAHAALVRLGIL